MGKVLFICGSHNQTTMMHEISKQLHDFECYFTPFFADGILDWFGRWGLLEFTILGKKDRAKAENYIHRNDLQLDYKGTQHAYDLIVSGTDTIVQKKIFSTHFVLVQEGMMEPETWIYPIVRRLRLPRYLANTAATGLSDAYDVFCVASEGYREEFIRKGINPSKIIVTGIPNFDNAQSYLSNTFPYRGYVLAATSPLRETFRLSNRKAFISRVRDSSGGRPIIFKLHPLENEERARREIASILPKALVLSEGNTDHMVANCDVLITEISSVTFTGLALGKEVYSNLDLAKLKKLLPIQNGGRSARNIATVCRQIVHGANIEMK